MLIATALAAALVAGRRSVLAAAARPDPAGAGRISRKRFWIPIHVAFEVVLIAALAMAWPHPAVFNALLAALASHAVMRVWSGVDFIPKALAFEKADPATIGESAARAWTRRSRLRLPLDLITCGALLTAFAAAARLG